ncbi:MAG: TRAP transporter TatT component family protein [Nitrospinota bacterium]|jgi:hypothetical protein|nr:TRAP transporter TatT component family protein [Nitrospinota bacterium]
MIRALASAALLLTLAPGLGGCSLKLLAVQSTAEILNESIAALNAEPDPDHAREAGASLLVMLEGLIRADPENPGLRRAAAQAYGGYAFAFFEEGAPERARRFYRRGRDHGLRALAGGTGENLSRLLEKIKALGEADLPLLFWTAYCWGGWINLSRNDPEALADLSLAEAMMARALALDPDYAHGGPELFFGVLLGGRSKLLGGDPARAKAHFERAVAASKGRFLMAKVLYARHYAVQVQDEKLFRRLLAEVEAAPPGLLPDQALANALARRRAAKLRKSADEYF